jgi:hypothetical protein
MLSHNVVSIRLPCVVSFMGSVVPKPCAPVQLPTFVLSDAVSMLLMSVQGLKFVIMVNKGIATMNCGENAIAMLMLTWGRNVEEIVSGCVRNGKWKNLLCKSRLTSSDGVKDTRHRFVSLRMAEADGT